MFIIIIDLDRILFWYICHLCNWLHRDQGCYHLHDMYGSKKVFHIFSMRLLLCSIEAFVYYCCSHFKWHHILWATLGIQVIYYYQAFLVCNSTALRRVIIVFPMNFYFNYVFVANVKKKILLNLTDILKSITKMPKKWKKIKVLRIFLY